MSGLVALLAAAAVLLVLRPRTRVAPVAPAGAGVPVLWWWVVGGGVAGALALWLDGRELALGLLGLLAAGGVARTVTGRRRATAAEARAARVQEACAALAADLRAGEPATRALERAADDWIELQPVSGAARLGADVPTALRRLATRPGAEQLRAVAAAWEVAHRSGAGLAAAVERAADHITAQRSLRRLLDSELSAAHATARMMAVLPFVMLLIGGGVGTDPLGFLLGGTPGLVCLAGGLGLSYAGMVWLDRIARGVLR